MYVPVVTVMIGTAFWLGAPVLVWMLGGRPRGGWAWLAAATFAVAISWFLPEPFLSDRTDTFMQHLVGGGVASALVAAYVARQLEVGAFLVRALLTLALVSTLGVANEVFELALDVWLGTRLTGDTEWDLVANTAGAAIAFTSIELAWSAIPSRRAG